MNKPTVLLVWQYSRKDWVSLFKDISSDFEFVFLAEVFPESSINNVNDFSKVVYWSKFKNAFDLINSIRPSKIVFMGLESPHTIALNYVAQKKGIETLYLQHGLYSSLDFYIQQEKKKDTLVFEKKLTKSKKHGLFMLQFYVYTFKLNLNALLYLVKYLITKNKITQTEFLNQNKYKYRVADKYLVYTKQNAKFLSLRDGFHEKRYVEIGNPNFDKFFVTQNSFNEKYILLIDTPLVEIIAEGKIQPLSYSAEFVNNFYNTLNEYALTNKLKLKIKLHPYSYESKFYLKHKNIDFIKEYDSIELINCAERIISFSSTLALPSIINKPFLLIRRDNSEILLNELEEWGVPSFPNFNNFLLKDILFHNISDYKIANDNLNRFYFYRNDGLATNRLIQELKRTNE